MSLNHAPATIESHLSHGWGVLFCGKRQPDPFRRHVGKHRACAIHFPPWQFHQSPHLIGQQCDWQLTIQPRLQAVVRTSPWLRLRHRRLWFRAWRRIMLADPASAILRTMRSRTSALRSSYTDSSLQGSRLLASTSSRAISPSSAAFSRSRAWKLPERPTTWIRAMKRPIRTRFSRRSRSGVRPPYHGYTANRKSW